MRPSGRLEHWSLHRPEERGELVVQGDPVRNRLCWCPPSGKVATESPGAPSPATCLGAPGRDHHGFVQVVRYLGSNEVCIIVSFLRGERR